MTTASEAAGGEGAGATVHSGPLLSMRGIDKRYAGVRALREVDFDVRPGEVHGLVGENGAGKSTLIKIVSGVESADAGEIQMQGQRARLGSSAAALAAGIGTVFQEPQVVPDLTVAENTFLGRELRTADGRVDWAQQQRRCAQLLESLHLDPALAHRQMGELPVATWQLVSIAKALAAECRVLILDEPSAILTARETETLFSVVRRLTAEGVGVIYISHRLDELFLITDRVTVLRDGQRVATRERADVTPRAVAELMVGHEIGAGPSGEAREFGEVALRTSGLARTGAFDDVDLAVHRGEVVALYGLIGCGSEDVAMALYGISPATAGEITVAGVRARLRTPRAADRLGVALLPADRKRQGMFGLHSITFNVAAGNLRRLAFARAFTHRAKERHRVTELVERLNIKTTGIGQRVSALSGGNQQKVVLARLLLAQPRVLILQEPTQGVDVGAKEEIHGLIGELAASGVAVLVVSSDLPEVLAISDRILVMREGRVTSHFSAGVGDAEVLTAATGTLHGAASGSGDERREEQRQQRQEGREDQPDQQGQEGQL